MSEKELEDQTELIQEEASSENSLNDLLSDRSADFIEEPSIEALEAFNALKLKLKENPYHYQYYADALKAARDLELMEDLQETREAMKAIFPLTENQWLEWFEDEIKLAASEEDKMKIVGLFDEAVNDYLSIPIWHRYIEFLEEQYETTSLEEAASFGIKFIRAKMRAAINATQFHFKEGHRLWQKIVKFEETILENFSSEEQINVVDELYTSHLVIPHSDVDETFSCYSSFVSKNLSKEKYEGAMKKASKDHSVSLRISLELGPYEDYLDTYSHTWEAYSAYIVFIKSKLSKERVFANLTQNLFERAIALNPLHVSAWESYLVFVVGEASLYDTIGQVAYRGARNCPWSGSLWCFYMRAKEESGFDEVEAVCTQALATGNLNANVEELTEIFLERCAIALRLIGADEDFTKLRAIFRESKQTLYHAFPAGDSGWRLLRLWARVETESIKDFNEARKVWYEIVRYHKNQASAWLQFSEFESKHGSALKAKNILKQGAKALTDNLESLLAAWMDLDRLTGNAESNQKTAAEIREIRNRHITQTYIQLEDNAATSAQLESKKEKARIKDRANKARIRGKRKRANVDQAKGAFRNDSKLDSTSVDIDSDVESPQRQKIKTGERNEAAKGSTLFVCNFTSEVDCSILRELFEKFGKVIEVRRPNPNVPQPRHFAYVQFETPDEAQAALALDGQILTSDMPLSVKLSDPAQRRPHPSNLELSPRRLFVSNLPTTYSQENLLELFQPYGSIDSVRILKTKVGTPNGCAIIEFSLESSGQAALALNSTMVDGRIIAVAFADPTAAKKPRNSQAAPHVPKNTKGVFKPRQIAHVSRPHNRINASIVAASNETKDPAKVSVTNSEQAPNKPPPRSNQDFRELLLGKSK